MVKEKKFNLYISYSQIAVFNAGMSNPFNDWTDQHVQQGFAWRPGSVSFRTIKSEGVHSVEVFTLDENLTDEYEEAERVIAVPFNVGESGVEVASISDSVKINIPKGEYSLQVVLWKPKTDQLDLIRLLFVRKKHPEFSIIKADIEIQSLKDLLKTASPAT
jgi:Competence protein J (ComJ)